MCVFLPSCFQWQSFPCILWFFVFFASANPWRDITSEGVAGDDSGSDVTVSGESQGMETTKEVVQGADVTTPRDISIEPEIEKRFGTEFWDCSIEEALLAEWESVEVPPYLHVPAPNKFIATNFELLQEVAQEDALSPDLPPSTVPGFPVIGGRLSLTPCLLTAEGRKGLPKRTDPCGKYKQEIWDATWMIFRRWEYVAMERNQSFIYIRLGSCKDWCSTMKKLYIEEHDFGICLVPGEFRNLAASWT